MRGFPDGSVVKNRLPVQETQRLEFNHWVDKDSPGGGYGKPTPVFLPGKLHRQKSLADYSPCGFEELDTTWRLKMHAQRIISGNVILLTQSNKK